MPYFTVYEIFGCFCLCLGHCVGMQILMTHEENVSAKLMMGMQWVRKYHWFMRNLFLSIFRRYINLR
jgi:hypothetical protein